MVGRSSPGRRTGYRPASLLIVPLWCALAGCGDQRPAAPPTLPPEQVAAADTALIDLIQRTTTQLALELDRALPSNATREHTVRLRLRVAEIVLRAKEEPNTIERLVQLWFWVLAFQSHMVDHASQNYPGQEPLLRSRARELADGTDKLVHQVIPDPGFTTLRGDLLKAASRGDAFYSIQPDQGSALDQLMSASHLQSLLSLPLAPFNALNGIGEGAKGLERLSDVGDRLITLLGDYPELLQLQMQLLLVQLQGQDLPRQTVADLDHLTQTAQEAVHELPTQIRTQLEQLLQGTMPEQQSLRAMLAQTAQTAEALHGLIDATQRLVTEVKPLLPPPAPPGTVPAASKPFDFKELADSLMALQAATRELRGLVKDTSSSLTSTGLDVRARTADAAVRDHIDRISLRIIEVLLLAFALAAVLIWWHRHLARRHTAAMAAGQPSGRA